MEASEESKGPSKRALEKEAKKAAAKAKKAAHAKHAPEPTPKPAHARDTSDSVPPEKQTSRFEEGWLRDTFNAKRVPKGRVRTRFPPEPNGFLHIGHAKAITINFTFAEFHEGTCNLRYDDTNPEKEKDLYFDSILEMVKWLGFEPDRTTYSSDSFDELYALAEELIERDKAYVCHCSRREVKERKGTAENNYERSVCKDWHRSPEENLALFRKMRDGGYKAGEAHLRMKQLLGHPPTEYEATDADSPEVKEAKERLKNLAWNPEMWDLPAYRITPNNYHHRTGDKWRIYPTYDFTHCLCDDFENITHSMCTVEFELKRPAYNWLLEALDRKIPGSDEKGPMQREYGRLNVEGTVLSKRKIAVLVEGAAVVVKDKPTSDGESLAPAMKRTTIDNKGGSTDVDNEEEDEDGDEGADVATAAGDAKVGDGETLKEIPKAVRGWDDPRLFTLVALRRRGIPPGALRNFVLGVGVTKADSNIEMNLLDNVTRSYLERTVPRLMLIRDPIKVTIENLLVDFLEEREVLFDKKDEAKGTHVIPFTNTLYIERDDFREVDDPDFFRLAPGKSVMLLDVEHPLQCTSFTTDPSTGRVNEIKAVYGKDVPISKTRIHWVGESAAHKSPLKCEVREYNPLFLTTHPSRPNEAPKKPNALDWKTGGYHDYINPESEVVWGNALIETGFNEVRASAPWPKEKEAASGKYSVRFQGVRTAYYCEDIDSTEEKIVLNRIVGLKEDTGKVAAAGKGEGKGKKKG
ncbi:Glutaminyl-tRNA synthetase [Elasticomyces elasticus]|nr:Glutaminyl-tRNA synthetase [Elasticomyces elasticus]